MTGTRPEEILRRLESDSSGDADLLARYLRRDDAAFTALVRRHGPLVLAICRRIARQDADDAFQAVFLILAQKAGLIRSPHLLGNWLHGVAVRVALKARRSAARRRIREVQVVNAPEPVAPLEYSEEDRAAALHEELENLPELYRQAIVLCVLQGVSRAEAATRLGIPEGTLSSRLAAGRKKLADRLTRRGIALPAAAISIAAVPESLIAKTCAIVADWRTGSALPAAVLQLTNRGFPMRTMLVGVLSLSLAALGVAIAAQATEEPPPMAQAPPDASERKEAPKPEPRIETVLKPRLSKTLDIDCRARRLVWSPDGNWFVIDADGTERRERIVFISQATPAKGEMVLMPNHRLVGITPDSKYVATDLRESGLASGLHAVRLWHVMSHRGGPAGGPMGPPEGLGGFAVQFELSKEHTLDPESTQQYGFPSGGETIRTLHIGHAKSGLVNRVEVFEAKLGEAAARSVFKADAECESVLLSPSGNRIAFLNKMSVAVHDIAAGRRTTFEKLPEADPPLKEGDGRRRSASFSPDESLILTALVGRSPTILSLNGDKPVLLEGTETLSMYVNEASFSKNNRLVAIRGVRYGKREIPPGYSGVAKRPLPDGPVGSPLIVWDARTGRMVKTWEPFDVKAVFHPQKPMLAIFEPNGSGTRIGFWDFVEESVEKK